MASVASIVASVIKADPFHKAGMSSGLDAFEALVMFGMSGAPRHDYAFRSRVADMSNRPFVWVDAVDGIVYREDFTGEFVAINRTPAAAALAAAEEEGTRRQDEGEEFLHEHFEYVTGRDY